MFRFGRARRTPAGRRIHQAVRLGVLLCAVVCLGGVAVYNNYAGGEQGGELRLTDDGGGSSFAFSSSSSSSRRLLEEEGSLYPDDIFSKKDLKGGMVFLHVIGVIYTFIAIAVVCDDFFVPALEVLVEKYDIDDDVAGATFMAAGGSAPELFTSLIGVFIAKSNVGFGTIIGSAVFNVLFVIGACAFFSSTLLVLTWWPLFRDCSWYTFDLCMLYVFFRDQKIELYESALLLVFYFGYVGFMKINSQVEQFVKTRILGMAYLKKANTMGRAQSTKISASDDDPKTNDDGNATTTRVATIREGFAEEKSEGDDDNDPAPPVLTRKLTKSLSRVSDPGRVKELVANSARSPRTSQASSGGRPSIDGAEKGKIASSEDGTHEKGGAPGDGEEDDEDDEEGIDLSWPEDRLGQVYYVIACPIMYLLAYTIPNCKKDRHLFGVVFLESILYIGFFSYFMVWWATTVGSVVGISDVVMGYTFLAAGTSVPDLMSSVIVARQGLGDMAVSSSIGSNIFDITFGLPLPWLLWSLFNGFKAIAVESDSLNFSLVLLILMLVSIVTIIALCGWKMTNTLGLAMVVLYGLFLTLVIMQAEGIIEGF